jgi:hypothetical protein
VYGEEDVARVDLFVVVEIEARVDSVVVLQRHVFREIDSDAPTGGAQAWQGEEQRRVVRHRVSGSCGMGS